MHVHIILLQHVDYENHYLCGHLKIQGLTDVSVIVCVFAFACMLFYLSLCCDQQDTFMTFFEGEIICKDHPFLTRKWVGNYLALT